MSDEDIEAVRAIARRYRWRNADSDKVPFLTEDELENLTIRAGTLTQSERSIINHHRRHHQNTRATALAQTSEKGSRIRRRPP